MLAELGSGLIASCAVYYVTRSYYRRKMDEQRGCNGHHWEIEYRASEDPRFATHAKETPYNVVGLDKTVVLKEGVKKRCSDCGDTMYDYERVHEVDMVESWKNE